MQLINREKLYPKSLGQDDVATVLLELVTSRSGFSHNGDLYLWDGSWVKYPLENFNEDIRLVLRNRWSQSKSKYIRESVLHNSRSTPSHLDGKIPFAQGYYDIYKAQFIYNADFVKDNRVLNYQTFTYDDKAECPKFYRALLEIFPVGEAGFLKRKAFLQFFAYCFVPLNYHKALILFGQGANGKSTLLDASKLFFPNHANIELQDFSDQNAILQLKDASMVYSHEGEFPFKAMSNFKKIAERKPLLVNMKYVDKFWIEINCKLMVATNHFPKKHNLDVALKRRMLVIDLDANFVGREDFNLLRSFESEMPGIFNLVMRELPELIKSNGDFAYNFLEHEQLEESLNVLIEYIEVLNKNTSSLTMTFKEFYDGYVQNCSFKGMKPIGKSKISTFLHEMDLGLERYNSAQNVVKVRKLPKFSANYLG